MLSCADAVATDHSSMNARFLTGASTVVLGIKLLGAAVALSVQIYIARNVAADVYGLFVLVTAGLAIAALVARQGLDTTLTRFTGQYHGNDEGEALMGLWRWARRRLLLQTSTVSVLALLLIGLFAGDRPSHAFAFGAGVLLLWATVNLSQAQAKNQGLRGIYARLPDELVRPLTFGVLVAVVLTATDAALSAATLLLLSTIAVCVALVTAIAYRRLLLPSVRGESVLPATQNTVLWQQGQWALLIVSGTTVVISQLDILLVGFLIDEAHAGIYGAAARLSVLASFALAAINVLISPMIASAHSKGDHANMQRLAHNAARFSTLFTAVVALLLCWQAEWVLGWFGEPFRAAANALRILLLGQLINALCGSVGVLQLMTGNEQPAARNMLIACIACPLLGIPLISLYGIEGAAVAATAATALWNILGVVTVRRRLHISTLVSLRA